MSGGVERGGEGGEGGEERGGEGQLRQILSVLCIC